MEIFSALGFEQTDELKTQLRGTCPFCLDNDNKFYLNKRKGLWDCKNCQKKGNRSSFIQYFLASGTQKDLIQLSKEKEPIASTTLRRMGVTFIPHFNGGRWVIPYRDQSGSYVSLKYYNGEKLYSLPDVPIIIYGLEELQKNEVIYLVEGEWDRIALKQIITKAKASVGVVAIPGASTFKEDWAPLFQDKVVKVVLDKDAAGEQGTSRLQNLLTPVVTSLQIIKWPEEVPKGFDIRDFLALNAADTAKTNLTDLNRLFQDPPKVKQDLPKVTSFNVLWKQFNEYYYSDDKLRDALAVSLATAISIRIPGDPIWMFLVGPSGSGKTLLLKLFGYHDSMVFQSSIQAKTLLSGFRDREGNDPSLILKLPGLTLVLKDFTEILSLSFDTQEEVFSILRGAFDGEIDRMWGNGASINLKDCYFSLLAGVTNEIHSHQRANLGERFLKFQMHSGDSRAEEHIQAAIAGIGYEQDGEDTVGLTLAGFLEHLFKKIDQSSFHLPALFVNRVSALSQIIATLRASKSSSPESYRVSPEVGTRLGKTLSKLGLCLAIVFNKPKIDDEVWRIVRQTALNTAIGWNFDIFTVLLQNFPKRLTLEQITELAQLRHTRTYQRLALAEEVNLVDIQIDDTNGSPGRPTHSYSLSPSIVRLCKVCQLIKRSKCNYYG